MGKKDSISGRVLHSSKTEWILYVEHKKVVMTPNQHVPPQAKAGDLFESTGTFDANQNWQPESFVIQTSYKHHEPFPPLESDWNRFHSLDGINPVILRKRDQIHREIRGFFQKNDFVEVHTPAMGISPGLETHLDAIEARLKTTPEGPIQTRWLMTSPEYHMKRLLSCDLERIFQIAKAFRSGETGAHHNPEFHMLEWYRANADWTVGVEDTKNIVCRVALALTESLTIPGWKAPIHLEGSWETLSIREAIERWAGFDPFPFENVERLRRLGQEAGIRFSPIETQAQDLLVRILVEKVEPSLPMNRPTVLTHYPQCMASLAQRSTSVEGTAERFEIYLGGLELANGFGELTDPKEQEDRLEKDLKERAELGLPAYPIDPRFLEALEVGIPPSVGVALGIDRLVMAILGQSSIANVLAFPDGKI